MHHLDVFLQVFGVGGELLNVTLCGAMRGRLACACILHGLLLSSVAWLLTAAAVAAAVVVAAAAALQLVIF